MNDEKNNIPAVPLFSSGAGCAVSGVPLTHDDEFGGIYIMCTDEALAELGITYGDSLDIAFSNGYKLNDLPYYNGYYNPVGEALIVVYPGYHYIKAALNFGDDLWKIAGIGDSDTASVSLAEKGKYLSKQTSRDLSYTDKRADYASDIVFANFRNVTVGGIKKGRLYRAASPCDNKHNRAPYVDALMSAAGVNVVIDLADNEEKIAQYMSEPGFSCPGFVTLRERGNVLPVSMNMAYNTADFKQKTVLVLKALAERKGPFLVHCTEGKDRTGFILMLIEALCGADINEIEDDFMITYDNYYGIRKDDTAAKYEAVVSCIMYPMLDSIIGEEGVSPFSADLYACAERYALGLGLSRDELDRLRAALTD
ncbi:MAG: tyrosine-protein phosphatase [Ruminiclostridium sp.]|nr:tyrosine-protein phosphatase [Ruminiclostridium sp.]